MNTTKTDPTATIAEHVAANFALGTVLYDLRESEGFAGDPDAEWKPAVTAQELLNELKNSGRLARGLSNGTPIQIPSYPVQINEDGEELFAALDGITELPEQLNAILVLLAESVALQKASRVALLSAVGLREHFGLNDH